MCCFTGDEPVEVWGTKIFARVLSTGEQGLAYAMGADARSDVAMVLPVPVRTGGRFKFVDLSGYDTIFDDLERLFPRPYQQTGAGLEPLGRGDEDFGLISVERVGAFDASFVPKRADFARLDKRFRIDERVWRALPDYSTWGFAVFKLQPGRAEMHPMAFMFDSAFAGRAFFPTVHVHHGAFEPKATFDHVLYLQRKHAPDEKTWRRSFPLAEETVDVDRAQRLVQGTMTVWRHELRGALPNADTWVP